MTSWAKWTAKTVLVTTGFAVAGGGLAGAAFAGTGPNTGNISVGSGNRVYAPVSVPIDVCGNAAAILGVATAGCQGGASILSVPPASDPSGGLATGNIPVLGGNVVRIPVKAPVETCGNAVGNATAHCQGGIGLPAARTAWRRTGGGPNTGNVSVGSGNQVDAPVNAPVDICGNAVAVLGGSAAGCAGGATLGAPAWNYPRCGCEGAVHPLAASATQLAGLGALPGIPDMSSVGGLTDLPILKGMTDGALPIPLSVLSAYQSNAGMSSSSFATLAVGALLAGAAALKLAARRPRARKSGAGQVSA